MSGRDDNRRRDRSRDRDGGRPRYDRERERGGRGGYGGGAGRRSRSRSPRMDDRGGASGGRDRRDYGRDDRRRDNRRDYDRERDRDGRRGYDRDRDGRRDHHDDPRDVPRRDGREREDTVDREARSAKHDDGPPPRTAPTEPPATKARMNLDPDAPEPGEEEGEAMEAVGDDDAAMMAMMGMSGFGTTKGKQVDGNQEGGASVKQVRTWRQYMNRRGGFNRPLDKIK